MNFEAVINRLANSKTAGRFCVYAIAGVYIYVAYDIVSQILNHMNQ